MLLVFSRNYLEYIYFTEPYLCNFRYCFLFSEAAAHRCSTEQLVQKISQAVLENIWRWSPFNKAAVLQPVTLKNFIVDALLRSLQSFFEEFLQEQFWVIASVLCTTIDIFVSKNLFKVTKNVFLVYFDIS